MEDGGAQAQAFDLEAIRVAYRRLLDGYSKALGDSQRIHRPKAGMDDPEDEPDGVTKSTITFFGPLVRLLVGSHVRSRIDRLGSRFSQLEPVLSSGEEVAAYQWVEEQRTLLEKMASNLPSLRIPGIFVAVPFAITLLTAVSDLPVKAWTVIPFIVFVLFPFFTAMVALVQAYHRKRQLFLENAKTVDKQTPEEQATHSGHNLYRDEEALFALLGSRRRPEMELDEFTVTLTCFLLGELCFVSLLFLESASAGATIAIAVLGIAFFVAIAVFGMRKRKRLWR